MPFSEPLLQTKLFIPPGRPDLVSRPRLLDQLSDCLNRALTVVSAPAGFGKTTLLAAWVAEVVRPASIPVAWVALEADDNEGQRFMLYLIAAIERALEQATEKSKLPSSAALGVMLAGSEPTQAATLLGPLINDLSSLPTPLVVVLDDYHLITSRAVHEALAFLLDHLPPQLHLVLATRADPPLPVARLRARRQLAEIRSADLRFTLEETLAFLNQAVHLDLSMEDIQALETRTEGWIAGLQMAALSLQGRPDPARFIEAFSGSHRFILDYLAEEVINRLPAHVQEFLLLTSPLERLCGSLCDAILRDSGRENSSPRPAPTPPPVDPASQLTGDSQAMLAYLERANLFLVPLDDERRWYRYHHLFADLLRARLQQTWPERIPGLHVRASDWFEKNGQREEAILHAFAAQDYERAARLIDEGGQDTVYRSDIASLSAWFRRLPQDLYAGRPWLCVSLAWVNIAAGQLPGTEALLQAAENAAAAISATANSKTADVTAVNGLMGNPLQENNVAADIGYAQTNELYSRDMLTPDLRTAGLGAHIASIRAYLAFYQGDIAGTIRQANLARRSMDKSNPALQRGIALQLGEAYLTQLDLEHAYPPLQEAARLTLAYGDLPNYTVVCCRLASLEKIRSRLGAAEKIYQENLAALDQPGWQEHPIRGMVTAGLADLLRERGALEAAHQMARQAVAQTQKLGKPYETLNALTILARTLLAQGQLPDAGLALDEALVLYREYAAPPSMAANLEAARLRLWLELGELEAALHWMQATRERAEAAPLYAREVLHISFARLLLAQATAQQDSHASAKALALLEQLAAQAEAGGRLGRQVEILALQALALAAQGQEADALRSLSASLALAEPHGYLRTYLDEGAAMGKLLARLGQNLPAGSSPAQAAYLHRLLSFFPNLPLPQTPLGNTAATAPQASPLGGPIEALTPRERDVLQLVCAGLSNQEIAERLFLSLNTVKRHNNNLFGKLGVSTRAQAILRAQELGLDKAPDS